MPALFFSATMGIEAKLPGPIEVQPVDALKGPALPIRSGIFRTRISKIMRIFQRFEK